MGKILKVISHRMFIVSLLILLQISWVLVLFFRFTTYSQYITIGLRILSILVVIGIMNQSSNPTVKLAWIIVILLIPLFGGMLYLFLSGKRPVRTMRKKLQPSIDESCSYLVYDRTIQEELYQKDVRAAGQVYYLEKQSGFPAGRGSGASYYPRGEECFEAMLEDLERAEHFIFLEYFIIEEGIMWNSVLKILERKVQQGVDVRVMYDDVGSALVLSYRYDRILREKGIKCVVFNRYIPIFSTIFNNRDHRKILVIDGRVAYTGGINFADEYINQKQRFGYWKDDGVRISGPAVHNMTIMFLQMWNAFSDDKLDYSLFSADITQKNLPAVRPVHTDHDRDSGRSLHKETDREGIILPYADHPLDKEYVGENVYLNLINTAVHYIYFFTPYLIIDNELATALILAAKRGVDVKIITPGIPDKKIVFLVTQSYYPQLVEGGVKIYQFRPGFVHSKCVVSDDLFAVAGTINLDYRSLIHHFENGVFFYKCQVVHEIRQDVEETLEYCTLITPALCRKNLFFKLLQGILRIFSPLL